MHDRNPALPEVWQERLRKADSRSDGRSDHGAAGEGTKIQLAGAGCARPKGRACQAAGACQEKRLCPCQIDGSLYELSEEIKLDKNIKHNIDIVVDRLVVKEGIESRLTDSIETVLKLAEGLVKVDVIGGETM